MSSSKPLGVPTKRISASKVTQKHKMGSLIVCSKKDNEKLKPNEEYNLIERRSLRLHKPTLLDLSEGKNQLIQNKSGDFEQTKEIKSLESQEKQFKRKAATRKETKEENFNKKPKLAVNQKPIAINESKNKTCEDIKITKNSVKKNRPQIFWENKLTGARRVSKRLSKLEMKNKQMKIQLVPENHKIHTIRHIPVRNENTYEKSTFRKQIFSGKTAHKRVKSNKFLVTSKVIKDGDIVVDKDIVISLKRLEPLNQESENQCTSYLEEPQMPEVVDEKGFVPEVTEVVEECQEQNAETETSVVLLSENEETGVEIVQVVVNGGEEDIIVGNVTGLDLDIATQSAVVPVAEVLDLGKSMGENCCDPELNEIEICGEIHSPSMNIECTEIKNTDSESENLELLRESICSANADENKDEIYEDKVELMDDKALVVEKLAEKMDQSKETSEELS